MHAGHVACLEAAWTRLEDAGHEVVAGWLLPCSLPWMFSKMQGVGHAQHALPSVTRVAICQAAVADSEWISVCPLEAAAGGYPSVDAPPRGSAIKRPCPAHQETNYLHATRGY